MNEMQLQTYTKNDLTFYGEIEKSASSSGKMMMSGFVSTTDLDLTGDIIAANAFDKHIQKYRERPIYLYQHDKNQPIGRVSNVITNYVKDGKVGLYLEDIVLSDIPVVRDVIWKLVQDNVLNQQSVGMYSIDGKVQGKIYEHTEVYLYECSLVSIAANPEAMIDVVGKDLSHLNSMEQLVKAYNQGLIGSKKTISMYTPENNTTEKTMDTQNSNPLTPDFDGIIVLKHNDEIFVADDSNQKSLPKKIEKDFEKVCDAIHACKSANRNSYMFQLGVATEKGVRYDWELTALSMARVLGANGGAHFDKDAKVQVVERIAEAYKNLGKSVPTITVADLPIDVTMLTADTLSNLEFKSVNFMEDEQEIYKYALFEKDVKRIIDAVKSYKGNVPDNVKECLKWIYSSVEIEIEGVPYDEADVEFLNAVTALIQQYTSGQMNPIEETPENEEEDDSISTEENGLKPKPMYKDEKAYKISSPPQGVRNACKRGIKKYEDGLGGDGLEGATVREARSLASGEVPTEAKVRKANRWWGRNERLLSEPTDSPADVACLLWGGSAGKSYFRKESNNLIKKGLVPMDEILEIINEGEFGAEQKEILDALIQIVTKSTDEETPTQEELVETPAEEEINEELLKQLVRAKIKVV